MNSSTSSSERATGREPDAEAPAAWRRFALVFVVAGFAVLAGLMAFEVLADPFDAGLAGQGVRGLPDYGPRFTHASRARDPAFDGAILGNSHIQLVDPASLTAATGTPFVSLIVPGTGPREQLALLDYLLRHRARPERALVFGLDDAWCTEDEALPVAHPFPFWLYERGPRAFFDGALRYLTLEHAARTLALRFGIGTPARFDGYWNYARDRFHPEGAVLTDLDAPPPAGPINDTGRFPGLDALGRRLAGLPAETAVVLVRPPVFQTALPDPDTVPARAEADCRAAMARLVDGRPGTALVDLRNGDLPEAQDPELWFDHTHYKEDVARRVEAEIAAALK